MAEIPTQRADIGVLRGVHLFHFATSNCSQRVRFALEEKGVQWVSHHVNLAKCENATPEFVALNPAGVVPVLIHDGATIVESNDIIRYIDDSFAGPRLYPESLEDREYLTQTLAKSSEFQVPLKLLMHEFLFKPFRRMNEKELADYSRNTKNPALIEFMTEFSSPSGFTPDRILDALTQTEERLSEIEERLKGSKWLSGTTFGLADISWVVNIHRFEYMRYPLEGYPQIQEWLGRVQSRDAFDAAVKRYESGKMAMIFWVYSWIRNLRGTSVKDFLACR